MGRALKGLVAAGFGAAAPTYEGAATAQRVAAARLAGLLEGIVAALPSGPVVEIGCGTGLFSRDLLRLCRGRRLWLTDLSPEMVHACRQRLGAGSADVGWAVLDGERLATARPCALVASAFAVHWFDDLETGLGRLVDCLAPGGRLLFSYQAAGSYPQWRGLCRRLGLPYTGNLLPTAETVAGGLRRLPVRWSFEREETTLSFGKAADFFRHLRRTGTATRTAAGHLGPGQLRRLLRVWDAAGPVAETVECHFFSVERKA